MKTAVIFGITGMDGSHLADLLLSKGYKVYGVRRRSATNNTNRINHLANDENFQLVSGDVTDVSSLVKLFLAIGDVDEVYNLAAQSHVGESFKQPGVTWDITGKGCMNILQTLVDLDMKHVRFYQASSSEMFGANYDERPVWKNEQEWLKISKTTKQFNEKYQNENTKHLPQSPYAIAKCAAHQSVRLYREAYDIHGSCGILFNHEGPRRGENFVTRKITKWIAEFQAWQKENLPDYGEKLVRRWQTDDFIHYCINEETKECVAYPKLRLGNLEAKRDWGHAKDYVEAMWLMLQQDEPDDYVICTGEARSVSDFLDSAFSRIGVHSWGDYVVVDPEFYRPAEVDFLKGDCKKAREKLNWQPRHTFDELVKEMVDHDINTANEKVQSRCESV